MDTCKNCEHLTLTPDPMTKELAFFCTRHPPTVLGFGTPQGFAIMTVYPKVDNHFPSCGEFESSVEVNQITFDEPPDRHN